MITHETALPLQRKRACSKQSPIVDQFLSKELDSLTIPKPEDILFLYTLPSM